ncbi:Translocation protein SEC62 [Pyrenophora tritici-repentis]|nr:Translocation protein SEC62 [Pyrenophora tritici-repentis]KAG9382705.1 Translocation protein SEC62 [Pyrenophora tritici-repentis]KAI0576153.1 Translocation protein SEC62 [Pyrenophora tritici-repentis]KAI0582260.1 Translocation protein SEC62 [Pyrenophora tritici-repentis]KAI0609994.1 Translocation protein SEC62 [Pyrenophora tritici-repentis]
MAEQDSPPQGPPQGGPPPGSFSIPIPLGPNGEKPTPEQIQQIQMQLAAEAQKHGITVQEYPGPPKPEALAVANWLKSQDLKPRTVVHDEKRKDMFRVKRAIRALQSPAYQKARAKNPLLPEVNDRASAENCFKLLPLSLLALRVSKVEEDAHEGHSHAKPKRVKGLWTVKIEQHQEANDDNYYIWLYEGSQMKQKLYAVGALLLVIAIVLFPLWPLFLRQGVWYLSMGMLGLIGLFFAMAIVRLILFIITIFAAPPGLWLYPNLFEDVGFFDSFRPVWAWQETPEDIKAKKAAKKEKKAAKLAAKAASAKNKKGANEHAHHDHSGCNHNHAPAPVPISVAVPEQAAEPVDTATEPTGSEAAQAGDMTYRAPRATVEEVDDE